MFYGPVRTLCSSLSILYLRTAKEAGNVVSFDGNTGGPTTLPHVLFGTLGRSQPEGTLCMNRQSSVVGQRNRE